MKRKRAVYRVKRSRKGWRLWYPRGRRSSFWFLKADAVERGRLWARARWGRLGEPAQLVVHGRDGRIQFEHTYGRVPARRKG